MAKISTLAKAHEELLKLGYDAALRDNSVAVKVGGSEHPFIAVVTHNNTTQHFQITCLVATLGQVGSQRLTRFAISALDANSRIAPFAYALLTDADDPSRDDERLWPVVLTHSVPIGDFSTQELESAMRSLISALVQSRSVIGVLAEGREKAPSASKKSGVKKGTTKKTVSKKTTKR